MYEGQVINNKKQGKGAMFFKNGDVYLGDWKDDEMDGNCIYIFSFGD